MAEFTEWDSFYVIIASAAGALIGLQFVVMTLIAEKPPKDAERASAAFATPTIVHFSASFLVSALMRAPWSAIVFPAVLFGLIGVGGVVYCAIVARRMKEQVACQPGFEDWLFHVALPLVSYAMLALAAFAAPVHTQGALFAVAAATLLLLFIGIHNAWDAVAYHVFVNMRGSHAEARQVKKEGDVMTASPMTVLVIGATGSIGHLVVDEALRQGHAVRALVRNSSKAVQLPREAQVVIGDVTRPDTLSDAVDGADAVVFTIGSDGAGKAGAESIDYGGVRNVLHALGSRTVRIALMTAIGVTNRTGDYNRNTEAHDWKRRSERLVRASGLPYTIVRPGWFDYNGPDQHRLVLLHGDGRQAGDSSDGVVARRQIAQILVRSLSSDHALRKTFELIAAAGAAQDDFDALFAPLNADPQGTLDGVQDMANMALADEPQRVRDDLDTVLAHHSAGPGARGGTKR